jgi:hypothetical protein
VCRQSQQQAYDSCCLSLGPALIMSLCLQALQRTFSAAVQAMLTCACVCCVLSVLTCVCVSCILCQLPILWRLTIDGECVARHLHTIVAGVRKLPSMPLAFEENKSGIWQSVCMCTGCHCSSIAGIGRVARDTLES